MSDTETEVNLDEITDESFLQKLLEQTEDIDDRKAIRARIQELRSATRAKRDEKLEKLTNTREDMLQKKIQEANEHKQRTLAMYDNMAKSSPAGGHKQMDIGIYKSFDGTPPGTPTGGVRILDTADDAIKQRQLNAEDRKKRILAAFDTAAKSGPAGSHRDVNFDAFKNVDVSDYENPKPVGAATFGSSGGVTKLVKAPSSQPGTPLSPGFPSGLNFPNPEGIDPMERAIRARQREAEERKRRTLAAYDIVAKQGVGPKMVCLEEFHDLNECKVNKVNKVSPRAKFQQLDTSSGTEPVTKANTKPGGGLARSPTDIKEMLLQWCRAKTKGYQHVEISNFSSSWADGMAFCALIHHFYPDAFDYTTLEPKNRRHNFGLAFRTAEEKGDISPLLDVEDMILMKNKPDWKCVFCYIQNIYRKLHTLD